MIHLAHFAVPVILVVAITLALVTDPDVRWRLRSQRPAERRGVALLRSRLTPEQSEQWDTRGNFEVIGGNTGRRYRLTRTTTMNVHELDMSGRTVAQWCFAPEGKLATGDVLLAQKIALERMELQVLALANTQASRS